MILIGHLWQIGVSAYLIVIGYGLWVDPGPRRCRVSAADIDEAPTIC
ncbi:hypothetical protein GS432_19855 [Rhodococcus hoagii]|nr:hypothetical protein [Prescottella equi]